MAKTPIDLSNFAVVKFGNVDIERNYINDILHAIVSRTDDLQSQISGGSGGGDSQGSFVLVTPEASEPNGRGLVVQTGVMTLNDNGPGTTIVVGIADGGIGTTQLADDSVTNDKLAEMPDQTFKGNNTGATANPVDLTATEATAMLDEFGPSTKGLVPPPGLSPAAGWYLHYDGTWSTPGGGAATVASVVAGTGIDVDSTDPSNPIVSLEDTAVTPGAYGDTTHWPTFTVDQQGRLTLAGSQAAPAGVTGADPTATIGLTAVNGSAGTFLRSDGAPPLSQAIAPTWTNTHTFNNQILAVGGLLASEDIIAGSNTTGGKDLYGRHYFINPVGVLTLRDVNGGVVDIWKFQADSQPATNVGYWVGTSSPTINYMNVLVADGSVTLKTNLTTEQGMYFNGVISPSALSSGNNNNYNPTGLSTASLIRITPDASGSTLTGITAPASGNQVLWLLNLGGGVLTLSNQSISSSAANRLILGATSLTINSGQGIGLWYDTTSTRWRTINAIVSTSGFQSAIQIQDEGVNQGSSGAATTLNVTGGGGSIGVSGSTATLNIPAFTTAGDLAAMIGGTGEDGNVDLDGVNTYSFLTKSGSTYTANRNIAIARLRISTGAQLRGNGGHISIQQWVCTSGFYGSINVDGGAANNASGATGGTAGAAAVTSTNYFASAVSGSNGTSSTSTNSASSSATTGSSSSWGGQGGKGGQGGQGASGVIGTTGNAGTSTGYNPVASPFALLQTNGGASYANSGAGSGGSGGTGDGTNSGGGGGGGGGGGAGLDIRIGEIVTDGSTPSGMLTASGGNGGNGAAATVGNTGGGGGGGAGAGGALRLILGKITGPSVSGFMQANGGNGGNAGAGHGTGLAGNGGNSGQNGRLFYYNIASSTVTAVTTISSGTAASGTTGGIGATASINLA